VKYLAYLDYEGTSMMDMAKKAQAYDAEKNKHSDKYPETVFEVHMMYKGAKGFAVWEATPEQVARKVAFMLPEVKYTLVPIMSGRKFLKTYMEVQK
jgi:hypothetical protein